MNLQEMKEKEINKFRKEVINWAIEHTLEDLQDVAKYGCDYMGNVFPYYDKIEEVYNENDDEINSIIENVLGVSVWDAQNDEDAFHIIVNNMGGLMPNLI